MVSDEDPPLVDGNEHQLGEKKGQRLNFYRVHNLFLYVDIPRNLVTSLTCLHVSAHSRPFASLLSFMSAMAVTKSRISIRYSAALVP